MTVTQGNKQAFIRHQVVTDVLTGDIELSYDLTVQWPEIRLRLTPEKAGVELGRKETQPNPLLYLNPTV